MPYVRFTGRCYIGDRIYEAGEEALIDDAVGLNDSMIDLSAEAKAAAEPEAPPSPSPLPGMKA